MARCLKPPSNHIRLDRPLLVADCGYGCSVRVQARSATYFSVDTDSRQCLLSLVLNFVPGRNASIYDFSMAIDFGCGVSAPPVVVGSSFVRLEEDTNFFQDFRFDVEKSPASFDERWSLLNYKLFFSKDGDSGDAQRVLWSTGRQSSVLQIVGEGSLGSPPGVITTLPVCILLAFPAPRIEPLEASFRIASRVEQDAVLGTILRWRTKRCHVNFSSVKIAEPPQLALVSGDRSLPLKLSFGLPSPTQAILPLTYSTVQAAQKQSKSLADLASSDAARDLVAQFIEDLPKEERAELYAQGSQRFALRLRQTITQDHLSARETDWLSVLQYIDHVYQIAGTRQRKVSTSDPTQLSGDTPQEHSRSIPAIKSESRLRRESQPLHEVSVAPELLDVEASAAKPSSLLETIRTSRIRLHAARQRSQFDRV